MIRFIDLTQDYFCLDETCDQGDVLPICAFADTVTNTFVGDTDQIFSAVPDSYDIGDSKMLERCLRLIPDGFFDPQSRYWQEKLR